MPTLQGAPLAAHLAKNFSLKEEVLFLNICNPDSTLTPDTPKWRWLAHGFRRGLMIWMKKHREEDKDGVQSYPWERKCLGAKEVSEWKVLRVGLSSNPRGHMFLEEPGLDSLFKIWATAGCGVARSAAGFGANSLGQHRTWPTLLFQCPGRATTRLDRRSGGPDVHADDKQHAGYGCQYLRWGKAKEGQGKCCNSGANGNGTITIHAAQCVSSDPRGATDVPGRC